jgi:hypothetical protein
MCHFLYWSVLITGLIIQRLKLFQFQGLIGNKNCDFINGYNITVEVYCTFNILNIFLGYRTFKNGKMCHFADYSNWRFLDFPIWRSITEFVMLQGKTFCCVVCPGYVWVGLILTPYITCKESTVSVFPRIPWVEMQCCMYFQRGMWGTFLQPLLPARIAVYRNLFQNYNYDEKGHVIFTIS